MTNPANFLQDFSLCKVEDKARADAAAIAHTGVVDSPITVNDVGEVR